MPLPRRTESVTHPLIPGIADKRLDLFTEGHYVDLNLSSALARRRLSGDDHIDMQVWSAPGMSKPTFKDAIMQLQSHCRPYRVGDWLGKSWTNHWVKAELSIPDDYLLSEEEIIFEFDPNCEGLIYSTDGRPIHAIAGGPNSSKDGKPGSQEDRRVEHIIPRGAITDGKYQCVIELSINAMFGLGLNGFRHQRPDMDVSFQLVQADLVLARGEARSLRTDFLVLTQMARRPDGERSSLSRRALVAANRIMSSFQRRSDDHTSGQLDKIITTCRDIAAEVLGNVNVRGKTADKTTKIWGIGHCHIDTAWLWRYTQTQQKIARSFSSQVELIKRYPQHHFVASSAQQYHWLEELYPTIYRSVQEQVKAGRFHPVGGSWLEHDCLLPSGESLCRQYLYGQRYFQTKFGVRCKEAWLPDTFGYASQLPQILRLAGIDYFFTQKLSWNNINVFPHSTFRWIGLDGSQVLSHMTPVDSYNAQANFSEVVRGVENAKTLGSTDQCLLLYGNGDGGGGPTSGMLEKLQRLQAASDVNPEMPAVAVGKVSDFFETIMEQTSDGASLPTWRGELYFELHRGIYTSQARIKWGNRTMEKLLRELEYYGTLASLRSKYKYPRVQLDEIWHDVMLNQFHDVLPGTSIKMVNDDVHEIYDRRIAQTKQLLEAAIAHLLPESRNMDDGVNAEKTVMILDPLRTPRTQIITLKPSAAKLVPSAQKQHDGTAVVLIQSDDYGCGKVVGGIDAIAPSAEHRGSDYILRNTNFSLVISGGRITSLKDERIGRELIVPGPGAENAGLMIYDDLPLAYDAWDAEIYHLDQVTPLCFESVDVMASGPLRASLKATAKFGASTISLLMSLDAVIQGTPGHGIQVQVFADWHETHKFLKFALPLDIHALNATYGCQYGLIERPTHRNTTLDQAKFEVCAHMIADLSEAGYGVSLVSEVKYGYAVEGNTMRLSMLRSATAPDPEQDRGHHKFSFAIMPHERRLLESGVYKQALQFINDVSTRTAPIGISDHNIKSPFRIIGTESVILDVVKRGEDDEKTDRSTVILRMFESLGGRTTGQMTITGAIKPKSLAWVNLLEEPMCDEKKPIWKQEGDTATLELAFGGFEIRTLLIEM